MAGPINHALVQQMVARELEHEKAKPGKFSLELPKGHSGSAMKPETLATIGGLADAAGTFTGLKHGTAKEANPMLGQSPGKAALGLLAQLAATKGATALMRKAGHPHVADAIDANMGARQLGLSADWGNHIQSGRPVMQEGNDAVTDAVTRSLMEQQRRK